MWYLGTCGTPNSCDASDTCNTLDTLASPLDHTPLTVLASVKQPEILAAALERIIPGWGHTWFALSILSRKGPAVVIIPTIASSPHSTPGCNRLQYAKEAKSSLFVSGSSELTFGKLLSRLVYVCWRGAPTTLLRSPSPSSSF